MVSVFENTSIQSGPPTHYTKSVDKDGNPTAVPFDPADPDIHGPLPPGWNDRFWKWEGGHPGQGGGWSEKFDEYLEHRVAKAKANAQARRDGGVDMVIGPDTVPLRTDDKGLSDLAGASARVNGPSPLGQVKITLRDGSRRSMTPPQVHRALDAVMDHRNDLDDWEETTEEALRDPANTTLADLDAISIDP